MRSSTAAAPPPAFVDPRDDCRLIVFEPVDTDTVQRLIAQAANKNCELDLSPTWIVKQFASELAPLIAALFNASFRDGVFPIITEVCRCHTRAEESDP